MLDQSLSSSNLIFYSTSSDFPSSHQIFYFLITQAGLISITWAPLAKALEITEFAKPVCNAVPIDITTSASFKN
jgi:hypothetical protein